MTTNNELYEKLELIHNDIKAILNNQSKIKKDLKVIKETLQITNNTITFDDLNIEDKGYSKRALYTFDNGNKISIVGGMGFYGNGIDDWEVAILDNDNKFITKDIVEDSFDDVLYEQTPKDINNIINQIQLI
jgi:hypothetical protein|tara:strand:- start:85 stop:480 length:396 start_codon:yes stop_codon:yes gene_type:complete